MFGRFIPNAVIAVSFLVLVRAELNVTQVQVLFRHGDRTPAVWELYPKDIHNVSEYEPWGLEQLTNTGKMRAYKIGQLLKTRYQELLGSDYVPNTIYAVSTDTDRTKMSLQLVLAGLFPPSEAQTWNSELPWSPIPIHYMPRSLDVLMFGHESPQFQDELARTKELPEIQAKIVVHNGFFKFLAVNTGLNITEPVDVLKIYNLLISQTSMNMTLSEWCTEDVFQRISEIAVLQWEIWFHTTNSKRLCGGRTVRQFIRNMHLDQIQENPIKIYLYSGHDLSVVAFLVAQGILELKSPLYGTAVMVEKLRDNDGRRFVRLVLWTGVTEQLITLRVPGCAEVCPIEEYLQLTREVIPSDEEIDYQWSRLSTRELHSVFEK